MGAASCEDEILHSHGVDIVTTMIGNEMVEKQGHYFQV
jgi:hypothetical protein